MTEFNNPIPVIVCMVPVLDDKTGGAQLLCVRRSIEPQIGGVAMPGGYLDAGETAERAAQRELEEETGVYIPETDWAILETAITGSNRLLILAIADYPISKESIEFKPNAEYDALFADPDTEMCFPIHNDWVQRFFDDNVECCTDPHCEGH